MTGKVLIIGNENKDAKLLHETLKKGTYFLSQVLSTDEAGLSAILKFQPDVIVLNPAGDFSEMMNQYHALRREEALSDIPFVAIVGEADLRREDLPSGLQEIFCRPLRENECVSRLLLLYRKFNRITEKNIIRVGDLQIDVSKYTVHVGDRKVDLTYTEYELLRFLAMHPDHVFSRDVLLNKVWGYEYYGGARTVDVHIRRLRSKIEFKSKRYIETVRNIGYKFISPESEES